MATLRLATALSFAASDGPLVVDGTQLPKLRHTPSFVSSPFSHRLIGNPFTLTLGDKNQAAVTDEDAPLITNITPAPGNITPTTAIQMDVTDPGGTLARVMLLMRWQGEDAPDTEWRCIYDGEDFDTAYADSTVTEIDDGFTFLLTRAGGWLATVELKPIALDRGGNVNA